MTTSATTLRRRIELVNLDEPSSVPFRFVFQLPHKLAPSYIRDGFRQFVVLYHILDGKTLDAMVSYTRKLSTSNGAFIPFPKG